MIIDEIFCSFHIFNYKNIGSSLVKFWRALTASPFPWNNLVTIFEVLTLVFMRISVFFVKTGFRGVRCLQLQDSRRGLLYCVKRWRQEVLPKRWCLHFNPHCTVSQKARIFLEVFPWKHHPAKISNKEFFSKLISNYPCLLSQGLGIMHSWTYKPDFWTWLPQSPMFPVEL